MNKKILIVILLLASMLTACIPKQDSAFKDVELKEISEDLKEKTNEQFEQEEQLKILKNYYELIENNISEDEIINNIKNNISKLDEKNADEMLIQFDNYLYSKSYDPRVITDKLEAFVKYSSEEFKSYFRIWETETENQSTGGEGISIPAEEIIDRALDIEKHYQKFPGTNLRQDLNDLYKTYISLSLKGLGSPYIFAIEGETSLDPVFLEMYKQKINENPDGRTAKILAIYIGELEKDSYNLNGDKVNYFYDNIDQIIDGTK